MYFLLRLTLWSLLRLERPCRWLGLNQKSNVVAGESLMILSPPSIIYTIKGLLLTLFFLFVVFTWNLLAIFCGKVSSLALLRLALVVLCWFVWCWQVLDVSIGLLGIRESFVFWGWCLWSFAVRSTSRKVFLTLAPSKL